jgi:hypothetical protein
MAFVQKIVGWGVDEGGLEWWEVLFWGVEWKFCVVDVVDT